MDPVSFEQVERERALADSHVLTACAVQTEVEASLAGDAAAYLVDGMSVRLSKNEGTPISITLPETVVSSTDWLWIARSRSSLCASFLCRRAKLPAPRLAEALARKGAN
jgi:hypothetical protein